MSRTLHMPDHVAGEQQTGGAVSLPALVERLVTQGAIPEDDLRTVGACGTGGLLAARLRMREPHGLALRDPYRVSVIFFMNAAGITCTEPSCGRNRDHGPSCMSVLPPAQSASWSSTGEAEYLLVCFPTLYESAERPVHLECRCLWEDPILLTMGLSLREVVERNVQMTVEESCAWSTVIGQQVARRCAAAQSGPAGHEHLRKSAARLNNVIRHIGDNLNTPLPVDSLAELAGMSRSKFSRAFRSATGLSPHQYIVSQRIHRAQQLLVSSQRPLVDIAVVSGFSSQSHMTTCFRRLTGQTPREFRDTRRQAHRLEDGRESADGLLERAVVSSTGSGGHCGESREH